MRIVKIPNFSLRPIKEKFVTDGGHQTADAGCRTPEYLHLLYKLSSTVYLEAYSIDSSSVILELSSYLELEADDLNYWILFLYHWLLFQ